MIADQYNIRFAEVLTDNGPEFGNRNSSKKQGHPFERMLGTRYQTSLHTPLPSAGQRQGRTLLAYHRR